MKKTFIIIMIVILLSFSSLAAASTGFMIAKERLDINGLRYQLPSAIETFPNEENDQILLPITTNDQILIYSRDFNNDNERFQITFDRPQINYHNDYIELSLPGTVYSMVPNAPMIPIRTLTLTYPPGTIVKDVSFSIGNVENKHLEKPVIPVPEPYPVMAGIDYNYYSDQPDGLLEPDQDIYNTNSYYPEVWYEYRTGMGLNPLTNDREELLVLHIYPMQYNPYTNQIQYIASGDVDVSVNLPVSDQGATTGQTRSTRDSREVKHDMVMICPSTFKAELTDYAMHKTNTGIDTAIVTLEEVSTGTYFPVQGRDQAEKIKYFIYNAIQKWEIQYVLLVGDEERIPTRITHVDESGLNDNEASDLYFADVFASGNTFCDWDYDNDDRFGEYSSGNIDKADLYPDIHIGRFPASNANELSTLVDKSKSYEITAIGQPWYERTILNGLDTFPGGTPEGEYLSDHIARNYLQDFDNKKLYESTNTLTTQNIKTNWNDGAGFVSFSDHGLHSSWGNKFSSGDVSTLSNGNKLPFVNYDACLTGEFDQGSTDCIAEKTILQNNGGGVAVVASSRIAYGSWGRSHINSVSGYLNVRLYHNMKHTTQIAGALLTHAKNDYLRNIGSGSATHFKTIVEYNYFGDPSLLLGGLPTAIYNLKCEDNTSSVKPGETAQYTITIENTDIQTRQILLSTSTPPDQWTLKLSDKSLTLPPGDIKNITLDVRAPDNELAGVIAGVTVYGSLANIERKICINTKTTVKRVYGFEITSDGTSIDSGEVYPGNSINFTFQLENKGNAEEKFQLRLISEQEDSLSWNNVFSTPEPILEPFIETDITVRLDIPQVSVAKEYLFNVTGKLFSTGKTKNMQLFVNVLRVYAVDLNCTNTNQTTDPNENLTFYLKLTNLGNHLEYFKLFIKNLPPDWSVRFKHDSNTNDTFIVLPFTSIDVRAIVLVPKGTIVGDYNLTLFAQCTEVDLDCQVYSSVGLNIGVNRVFGISLLSEDVIYNATPGDTITQNIQVINLGNYRDFADLEVINKPANWNVILERNSGILLYASDTRDIGISITPAVNTIVGKYNVYVRGTIDGDNSFADLKIPISINRIYGVNISNNDPENEFKAGDTWVLDLFIENLGNDNERFKLYFPEDHDFGKATLKDNSDVQLKAFYGREIELQLTLDENAFAGEHIIPITATMVSTGLNYTFDIGFNILHTRGIELSSIKDYYETEPGKEVKIEVMINNIGNSKEEFSLEVVNIPQTWSLRFPNPQTVVLPAFTSKNYTFYFRVPSDESYHDVDLEFRIQSKSHGKTNDILPATISIKEDKYKPFGLESDTFNLVLIIVILIIVGLIIISLVIRRRMSGHESDQIIHYGQARSSDGSQVIWDETSEPIGDQYNPPTPMSDNLSIDIQVHKPNTYLQRTYAGPGSLQYDHRRIGTGQQNTNITQQSIQTLPFESKALKQTVDQSTDMDFEFKKPKSTNFESVPVRRSEPIVKPGATYPVQSISQRGEQKTMRFGLDTESGTEIGKSQNKPVEVVFEELSDNRGSSSSLSSKSTSEYHESSDGLAFTYNLPKRNDKTESTNDNNSDMRNSNLDVEGNDIDSDMSESQVKIFRVNDGLNFKRPQHYSKKSKEN